MSWGSKMVLLVMGLGVAHASLPQSFVEPEFGFDPALFSKAGGQPLVYPRSAEPSMVVTSRVILPAGAEQMYNPVTGYVQGWWKQVLDHRPGWLSGWRGYRDRGPELAFKARTQGHLSERTIPVFSPR